MKSDKILMKERGGGHPYGIESELKNHPSDSTNSEGIWPGQRIETKIVYQQRDPLLVDRSHSFATSIFSPRSIRPYSHPLLSNMKHEFNRRFFSSVLLVFFRIGIIPFSFPRVSRCIESTVKGSRVKKKCDEEWITHRSAG